MALALAHFPYWREGLLLSAGAAIGVGVACLFTRQKHENDAVTALNTTIQALCARLESLEDTIAYTAAKAAEEDFFDASDQFTPAQVSTVVVAPSAAAVVAQTSSSAEAEPVVSRAQQLYDECDRYHSANEIEDSVKIAMHNKRLFSTEAEGLWRLCRAYYDQGQLDKDQRKACLEAALPVGLKAIKLAPDSAQAHRWYAVVKGAMADFAGLQEKIECGTTFRKHVQRSIELDPNVAMTYHLLGRFCFEVAKLSWYEKQACKAFIGTPPEATWEETLKHFEKADELDGSWLLNKAFVAKTLAKLGRTAECAALVREIRNATIVSLDDKEALEEVKGL